MQGHNWLLKTSLTKFPFLSKFPNVIPRQLPFWGEGEVGMFHQEGIYKHFTNFGLCEIPSIQSDEPQHFQHHNGK